MITEEDLHQTKEVDHQCNLHLINRPLQITISTEATISSRDPINRELLILIIQTNLSNTPAAISTNHHSQILQ